MLEKLANFKVLGQLQVTRSLDVNYKIYLFQMQTLLSNRLSLQGTLDKSLKLF